MAEEQTNTQQRICKNDTGIEPEDKDILPKTRAEANKNGLSVGEQVKKHGIADTEICWLTGKSCGEGVKGCDLKENLEGIDLRIAKLVKTFRDEPEIVYFFLSLFGTIIKQVLSEMNVASLQTLLKNNSNRLSNLVLAEISLRKKEISEWTFCVNRTPSICMLLVIRPKHDFGDVIMRYDYIVKEDEYIINGNPSK